MAINPKEKQEMLETKAFRLLEQCETVIFASINEQEFPRVCVMSKSKINGFKEIF